MRRILLVLLAVVVLALGLGVPAGAGESDVVTVIGPIVSGSPDGDAFVEELSAFAAKKGFEISYDQYLDLGDLVDRVKSSEPPDVIVTPTPGVLFEVADELIDLSEIQKTKKLSAAFGEYLVDVATSDDGAVLGVPIKVDLKSLVWYQPDVFAASGYTAPETFDELIALSDRMVADGETPWCNYIESGPATGWLGTDWVEDLVLGAEGPGVYDGWVDHDVIFQDPRIETAFERYQQMTDTPGYVWDRANMLSVPFIFNAEPLGYEDCLMHRQAAFFGAFIGGFGFDIDDFATFKFPSVNPEFGEAAVGGALHVAALDDRHAVKKLTEFMMSKQFGETALASSGFWILPNTEFDHSLYPNDLIGSWADITRSAIVTDLFRFDASDMMPPDVGFGTFWAGIADLVAGTKTVPQILTDIDTTWPS